MSEESQTSEIIGENKLAQRWLVTGGSGFIGTNLLDSLAGQNIPVLSIDKSPPRNSVQRRVWQHCDILQEEEFTAIVREFQPQVMVHLAARTDLQGKNVREYRDNTEGVNNVIAAAEAAPCLKRLVFASSRLVCRIGYTPRDDIDYCPSTPYGESKATGEEIIRSSTPRLKAAWTIIRPTSIWGPWFEEPYRTFFLQIQRGRYVNPGRTPLLKSFGFVGNSIYQIQRLVEAPSDRVAGRTFYLGDYPPTDVARMADLIRYEFGAKPIHTVPVLPLKLVARLGDGLKLLGYSNPPLTSFRLNNLCTQMIHDLQPLYRIAGPLPYSLEEGVRVTVGWLRSHLEAT